MQQFGKLNMQDAVDFEMLGIYLRQSRMAVYCTLIPALYLAISFYQVADTRKMAIWMVTMFAVNAYIVFSSFQFSYDMPVYKIRLFMQRQNFLHVLSGLAWGLALFTLVDTNSVETDGYRVAVILAIVVSISASSKAASLKGMIGFVLAVSCMAAWYFVSHFSIFAWWLFGTLGLLFVCIVFGLMTNQYILGQVENRLLNEDYVEELKALHEKIEKTNEDFVKRNLELQDIQAQLEMLAAHDALTGLYNRRYILERIEEKLPEIKRHHLDCCLVIMDIDFFKDINDHFGHIAGDDVLKIVSQLLAGGVRQGDIVARYGGEEFLIFLPMTDLESAKVLVDRLRVTLAKYEHKINDEVIIVTASFGIAQHGANDSVDRTIARADKALYQAKEAGRNRTVLSTND